MKTIVTLVILLQVAACGLPPGQNTPGYPPAAGNYNPISGSVTGSG